VAKANGLMDVVLDLDLDFFVWPVATWIAADGPRLSDKDYQAASVADVVTFLEQRCGLSTSAPKGTIFQIHADGRVTRAHRYERRAA
jgi:hypothetical protein